MNHQFAEEAIQAPNHHEKGRTLVREHGSSR